MDRRRAAGALLALALCVAGSVAAPTSSNDTALDIYDGSSEGCYYNFQYYGEGDRIMTNEPCLNCTCHNRMLMCYLRVCPFTKPIGQDCTVEKRADQCCPIVTCPDVPVDLLTSTSTTSPAEYGGTGLGRVDKYGCEINGKYFPEGAKVPPSPNKPCEHCYCIRNMTTCVMQECTLHVEGCTPIYNKDVCCPIRYSCDHPEDEIPMLDDMTTTVRPTPGFLLTTTTLAPVTQSSQQCIHNEEVFLDGAVIKTEKACEHCYCMKGDIVCIVQECGTPMENEGKNCTSVTPREGQCCPDTYICEGDDLTTEIIQEPATATYSEEETTSPPRRVGIEGSGYRNEDDLPFTEVPIFATESEGSGEEPAIETVTKLEIPEKEPELIDEGFMMTDTPHKFSPQPETATTKEAEKATTEPDKGLNTVPDVIPEEDVNTETPFTEKPIEDKISEQPETTTTNKLGLGIEDTKEKMPTEATITQNTEQVVEESVTKEPHTSQEEQEMITTISPDHSSEMPKLTASPDDAVHIPKITTTSFEQATEEPKLTTIASEPAIDIAKVTTDSSEQLTEEPKLSTISSQQATEGVKLTSQAEVGTTETNLDTTDKTIKETEGPLVPETTTINMVDNEIDEESTAYPPPGRIPGEGDCLLDGVTYRNESSVLSKNKCHASCKCVSSIIKCDPIICATPPEYMDNCQSVYDSPDACCPTYVCDHSKETVPPQPHNQMSGTESPIPPPKECKDNECQIPLKETCSSGNCDETQTAVKPDITECGSEGCDGSKTPTTLHEQEETVPCVGENCVLPSSETNPELTNKCEGDSCKDLVDSEQDKEKCEGTEGCKLPEKDVVTEECLSADCRRTESPVIDKQTPQCSGADCGDQQENKPELTTDSIYSSSTEKVLLEPQSDISTSEKPQEDLNIPTELSDTQYPSEQSTKFETASESVISKETEKEPSAEATEPSLASATDKIISEETQTTKIPDSENIETTTQAVIKEIPEKATEKPESTNLPSEMITEHADKTVMVDQQTTLQMETHTENILQESSQLPEKLETQQPQETTEPSKSSDITPEPQENEILTDQHPTTSEPKPDQSSSPSGCDGAECKLPPAVEEQQICDSDGNCKLPEQFDATEKKTTDVPTNCVNGQCDVHATSLTPIIPPEQEKCDNSEGCNIEASSEKATEAPAKCEGTECEAIIPVQPVVPEQDKCDNSEDCKLPESNEIQPSCSGNDCDSSNNVSGSAEDEVKPELEITTKESVDLMKPESQTPEPFTNIPTKEITETSQDVTPRIEGIEPETKKPLDETVTEPSLSATEMQDTSETTKPGQDIATSKPDSESLATTISPNVNPDNESPEKPDYHDTEPEKHTTDKPYSEDTGTELPALDTDKEKEISTLRPIIEVEDSVTQHSETDDSLVSQTTQKTGEQDKPDDGGTEMPTTKISESKEEYGGESTTAKSAPEPADVSSSQTKVPEIADVVPTTEPATQDTKHTTIVDSEHISQESTESSSLSPTDISVGIYPESSSTQPPKEEMESENNEHQPEKPTEQPMEEHVSKLPEEITENNATEKPSLSEKPEIIEEVEATTKVIDQSEPTKTTDVPSEVITKTPEEDVQSQTTLGIKDDIGKLSTQPDLVINEITTQSSESMTSTKEPIDSDTYSKEPDTEQKTSKPIATESQILMTEPTKIQDDEGQFTKQPEIEPSLQTTVNILREKEPTATSASSESVENEPEAVTMASEVVSKEPVEKIPEPVEKESAATTIASISAENELTTLSPETSENEASVLPISPLPTGQEPSITSTSMSDEKGTSSTTLASVPIEEEPSKTTMTSEPAEIESRVTTMASKIDEKETNVTPITSEERESSTTTVASILEKETSATSPALESELSGTTMASEPVENEQRVSTLKPAEKEATTIAAVPTVIDESATTMASEYLEKEPIVTSTQPEKEIQPSATTNAPESVEKATDVPTIPEIVEQETSATTITPKATEPSATTVVSEPTQKEPSVGTTSSEMVEKEPSATTVAPEQAEKEPSEGTTSSEMLEKEPSATTVASVQAEKEPSGATTSSEMAEKEPSGTTMASVPAEKEPSEATMSLDIAEKEPIATTMASEPAQKEPSGVTTSSVPIEGEPSATSVESEPAEKLPSEVTTLSEMIEKDQSATTVASEPAEKEPTSPEMVEKEPSATSVPSEEAEKQPSIVTTPSVPIENELSTTTLAPEPADKAPSDATPSSEIQEKEPSATTVASEPAEKEPSEATSSDMVEKEPSATTVPSDLVEKEPSVVTASSEIIEKEPSMTTMASEPIENDQSKLTTLSESLDKETSSSTMASEPAEKEPNMVTESSETAEIQPSVTTIASEPAVKEPSATTLQSELTEKESSETTMAPVAAEKEPGSTMSAESIVKESSATTISSEPIEKESSAATEPSVVKDTEADSSPEKSTEPSINSLPTEVPKTQDEVTTQAPHSMSSTETTEPSESTPDQIELELHTHKAPEESENEITTTFPELLSSEMPEQQTTTKIEMVTEKQPESEPIDEPKQTEAPTVAMETTLAPVDELKDEDIRFGKPSTSEEEKVVTTTEKLLSETPIQPESTPTTQRPSIITEEEFIPVTTTKVTTTTEKIEEEPMQTTPAIDRFTKTEEKPEPSTESPELPKPVDMPPDETSPAEDFPPSGGYGQEPDYMEEDQHIGPGTCRYGGKVYVSAQQIPRDDPCDFCFCFRSDIICLQQSCPPPIHGCHEEPISGFCCPRYECPVSMATTLNVTTTTTTTTTTLPPHFFPHAYQGKAHKKGCVIKGQTYKVGDVVRASSGPCLHCTCGGDGQMKCDPKACTPEPMLRQMIAAAVSARRRR